MAPLTCRSVHVQDHSENWYRIFMLPIYYPPPAPCMAESIEVEPADARCGPFYLPTSNAAERAALLHIPANT